MPWWQFVLLGAGGGAIVEVLATFRCVAAWQDARRSHDGTIKRVPPELARYVDVPAHAIMLPARMLLGAAVALLSCPGFLGGCDFWESWGSWHHGSSTPPSCGNVILSFRVSRRRDLWCPVVDSVADGTLAA
jgi:hypothetical protein